MRMNPKSALRKWLSDRKLAHAEFARRIGYDKSNFHRLLNSSAAWPSLELAHAIERETDGAIPMADWAVAKAA